MAENILGLLFVTSSSKGRNVYRYPPDPFSPHTRLSQPIYPSATFTAKDAAHFGPTRNDKRRLFASASEGGGRSTEASLKSANAAGTSAGRRYLEIWSRGGSAKELEEDSGDDRAGESETDSSSSGSTSSSSELETTWANSSPNQSKHAANRGSDGTLIAGSLGMNGGRLVVDGNGSVRYDGGRRGSVAPSESIGQTASVKGDGPDRFVESQYNRALSYPLDFLGDMLTPPRSACNRKFEICVDELVFVGHPVCCGPDGKWSYPEDEDDGLRPLARGRKTRKPSHNGERPLGTVLETKEGMSPDMSREAVQADQEEDTKQKARSDDKDGPPSLNMFHLVMIVDKPDPKLGHAESEGHAPTSQAGMFDEVYREIAFKWTAAAYAMQVKENFIARETWEMARIRERCINEGVPILECCRILYENNSLDRSLNQLFTALHDLQTKPANPLYSHLPTTITINLVDMPISMVLSPRSQDHDEAWAHWGEIDGVSSGEEDEDSEAGWEAKAPDFRVEPWQTLLLVDDDATEKAHEISRALVGLGVEGVEVEVDDAEQTPTFSRRDSKDTSAEEDEGLLMKAIIEACDVTKRLVDIAHILRFDLEGIVIPLARELVQNKKAILVDVLNTRLRTVVMPTTIAEHTVTLEEYTMKFSKRFRTLPLLPQLIALISASPVQFREILPPEAPSNIAIRQLYLDALVWLLKQDLVVQVHTRARIFARPEVKEIAWRKLWKRRRERWLRKRSSTQPSTRKLSRSSATSATSTTTTSRSASGTISKTPIMSPVESLTTPRASHATFAGERNPMDSIGARLSPSIPPPLGMSPRLQRANPMDQSFMDYDPDLEMDSDLNEDDEGGEVEDAHDMEFSLESDEPLPEQIPKFEGSFIFRPARAQKDEARWLRVIREPVEEVWASKFDLCVQYFDGIATFEEISYRTGMQRRELDRILQLFADDLVTFIHP